MEEVGTRFSSFTTQLGFCLCLFSYHINVLLIPNRISLNPGGNKWIKTPHLSHPLLLLNLVVIMFNHQLLGWEWGTLACGAG